MTSCKLQHNSTLMNEGNFYRYITVFPSCTVRWPRTAGVPNVTRTLEMCVIYSDTLEVYLTCCSRVSRDKADYQNICKSGCSSQMRFMMFDRGESKRWPIIYAHTIRSVRIA